MQYFLLKNSPRYAMMRIVCLFLHTDSFFTGRGKLTAMPNIGVVLAGCASKGAYEIGCLRAIEERFGKSSIKCISSASIGSLVAQAYGIGKTDELEKIWKGISTKEHGRFFLMYCGNKDILARINETIGDNSNIPFEHYVSVWNYTQHKVEYIPFHKLSAPQTKSYLRGAIAIPFFSKGEIVDGDRIMDGAFVDNIPAYPLLDKELDYIFCVYFDNCKYFFENEEFNKKIIKLCDFPNEKMFELMTFKPDGFDDMVKYGYDYTMRTINEVFVEDGTEAVYKAIAKRDKEQALNFKPRLTADIVLNNINVVTKRYAHRLSHRIKEKE